MNTKGTFSTIIDVDSLNSLMNDPDPDHPLVIVDARFSLADPRYGRNEYEKQHLAGAFFADLEGDLSRPQQPGDGRHPLPDIESFAAVVGRFGLTPASQVVVYDDAGGGVAGRLWWMLRHWLDHPRVAVLDGDFRAWLNAGLPVTDSIPEAATGSYVARINPAAVADIDEIISASAASGAGASAIIDARSNARFRGDEEPIDPVAGHIPGSKNMPMTENLDQNGHFLPANELRSRFQQQETGQPKQVVHSCGSGVSACHNLLAMDIAGLPGSRLYVGSWSEWIADPSRSVATGEC